MKITAYIGQQLIGTREPGRSGFMWRLRLAIGVLLGKCDVITWDKWEE